MVVVQPDFHAYEIAGRTMFIFATSPLKPMYAAEVSPLAPLELHLVASYPVGAVRAARAVLTPGWVVSTVNVPQLKASAKVIFS